MKLRAFTEHPASVGETYVEHCRMASAFARSLAKATFACSVHAVFPCFFEKTASSTIDELHQRIHAGARGPQTGEDGEPLSLVS